MHKTSKKTEKVKSKLHKRNKNNGRYNFEELTTSHPELKPYVIINQFKNETIDFANAEAVKELNKALLKNHYNVSFWDIPDNYLCPPIPGRADYIHYIADLLCSSNFGKFQQGSTIKGLDVGVGANCIYPIIGRTEYEWSFIASDIDQVAIDSATKIVESNPALKDHIECRLQPNDKDVFYGVLSKGELVDFTICNPPFHASAEDAKKGSLRKVNNLNDKKVSTPTLNFGGQSNELWCEGGERRFILNMIKESKKFADNCFWFSTLVSKQTHLNLFYATLKEVGAYKTETIAMSTGNKSTRIMAWTFLNKAKQKEWKERRWDNK